MTNILSGTLLSLSGRLYCEWAVAYESSGSKMSVLREGAARITLFASSSNAQTLDFYVRYIPNPQSPHKLKVEK